jgi:hypothetical protein
VIRLATRLAVGASREGVVRLTLTAMGLALATVMLLCAAVAFPALHAHEMRRAWMDTSEHNRQPAQDETTTDPLLWRVTETRFDGRDLVRVDVAAEGPDAPVPRGLDALPADGELAASPALHRLLDRTEPAMLSDRFPGQITATVGPDALASPDDLVVFVGRAAADLRTEPDVINVRSIEAAPTSLTLTRVMRLAIAVGAVGLLGPVVVFVATAARLAAARRESRLAAMRLAGATPRQMSVVAAVEAAMAALAGTAVGFGLFFAIRPSLARIPLDGDSYYPADLHVSWSWAAAIALGVPLLAVGTAVVSLRHARISPLGVTRRAARALPSPGPLLIVAAGMAGLLLVRATMMNASDTAQVSAIAAALLAMIAGIVLSGAWLTLLVARTLSWAGRGTASLLAARRLQDNPAAGFRAIGGLILAVFVGTVFSSFSASVLADDSGVTDDGLGPGVVVAALQPERPEPPAVQASGRTEWASPARPDTGGPVPATGMPVAQWPFLEAADQAQLMRDLVAVPGIEQVTTAHALPDDLLTRLIRSEPGLIGFEAAAMACPDGAAVGLRSCDGTTAVNVGGGSIQATGVDVTDALPVEALAEEPAVAFALTTDGTTTTIERARTLLERAIPGGAAVTQADVDAENERTTRATQRISNQALAVTLVIAGCSLAVAVASSIVERRQPFALLRMAGTRLSDLRRVVLAEAAAPLLMVAIATSALGLAVTALTLATDTRNPAFALPGLDYWLALVGGLAIALGVVAATLPLLNRLTSPESVRIE